MQTQGFIASLESIGTRVGFNALLMSSIALDGQLCRSSGPYVKLRLMS
jgi:hypothetical protein